MLKYITLILIIVIIIPSNSIKIKYNGLIDSKLVNTINSIDSHHNITLILTSTGGYFNKVCDIYDIIQNRTGSLKVIVNEYAYSSATVLCLIADECSLTDQSLISAINPILSVTFSDGIILSEEFMNIINYLKYGTPILKNYKDTYEYKQKFIDYIHSEESYYFEYTNNKVRNKFNTIINKKYNINKILKFMFDKITSHNQIFTFNEFIDISTNYIYK
jgi:ClpP class serine protease